MFDVIEPQSRGHRERLPQFVFYALRICVGRHCYQPDDLVAVARPRNGERGAFEPGNLPHQAFHMRRVNEYFPNLDGGTHPALQRRDAADATVWRRLNRDRNITSAEADHRPAARQRRHHDFAGFTMRNRRACLGIAYLDVAIGMNLITGLPAALKSNETEVRGAVTGTMC